MGPMGLQCEKLQRDDLDHYWQPLQERRRGHGKNGNVPTTDQIKEERTDNISKKTYKEDSDTLLCLCCSDFCIAIAETVNAGCIAGSVTGGHTMHVPGISLTGL